MQRLGVLGSIGKSVAKAAAKPQPAPAPEPVAVVVAEPAPAPEPVVAPAVEPFLSVSEFAPPVTQSTSLVEQEPEPEPEPEEATEDLDESLCASHLAPEPTTSSHTEVSSE